ncbi:MAG TPA: hypothetical protein VFW03_07550 [Gemmatimonadaceae bacterium]|nr:hypothetical protein [Gemmatimonadaceae bacterium]
MPEREKPEPEPGSTDQKPGAADIEQLADRVYRLMLAELRLERARGGGMNSW